jgi:hypothetical protein
VVLDAHPDLLSRRADVAFQALVQAALDANDDARFEVLASHHELLRACHVLGVDEAFRRAQQAGEEGFDDLLMALGVVGHNTIAVMVAEPDKRAEWLREVRQMQHRARGAGDEQMARLLSAVMKLLNGKPLAEITVELEGGYAAVWEQIAAAVGKDGANGR